MKNIAIVGATGLVGSNFIKIIEEKKIRFDQLYLYASSRSAGKTVLVNDKEYTVIELSKENILDKQIDYALFSAGGGISALFAQYFVEIGAVVIDNSSQFRMDKDVPLVVPEVNMSDAFNHKGIIANPNCSTIQSVLPLYVLDELYGVKTVHYATYQAVSGSGLKGIKDLEDTSNGLVPSNYPHPIYNNCLPHIDRFLENGYTYEEMKMINETKKILNNDDLLVSATCVRVPVINSHSVEMNVELNQPFSIEDIKKAMSLHDGITLMDDVANNIYPLAGYATGKDDVFVGRIRQDITHPNKLHLFCVADNIRKGAALNAVQILEELERSE